MTVTHHPGIENLMSCSAGSQPEAFAAVMAAHITMCPACCHELSIMERIGTVLFGDLTPSAMKPALPAAVLGASEADSGSASSCTARLVRGDVPATLQGVLGSYLDDVPWKRVKAGVWQHRMALSGDARGELRLMKVAPGLAVPEHTHGGTELTLVLRGAYSDETGTYRPGDVSDLDGNVVHRPVADPAEGCVCLVATQGKLRFKGVLARLVQPFTGF